MFRETSVKNHVLDTLQKSWLARSSFQKFHSMHEQSTKRLVLPMDSLGGRSQ